jgi:hypothetical protein
VEGPPEDVLLGLPGIRTVFYGSERSAVVLDHVDAYQQGARVSVSATLRTPTPGAERAGRCYPEEFTGPLGDPPDDLVRFELAYRDGTRVSTLDRPRHDASGPHLIVRFEESFGYGEHDEDLLQVIWELLLWPLPPAEPFALAVEWPTCDIPLTRTTIDGAELTRAATEAKPLWR